GRQRGRRVFHGARVQGRGIGRDAVYGGKRRGGDRVFGGIAGFRGPGKVSIAGLHLSRPENARNGRLRCVGVDSAGVEIGGERGDFDLVSGGGRPAAGAGDRRGLLFNQTSNTGDAADLLPSVWAGMY